LTLTLLPRGDATRTWLPDFPIEEGVQEMRKANNAIVMDVPTGLSKEDDKRLDYANREIDSINKYWQIRLGHLIEFIETQNPKFNKELAIKYLSSGGK